MLLGIGWFALLLEKVPKLKPLVGDVSIVRTVLMASRLEGHCYSLKSPI